MVVFILVTSVASFTVIGAIYNSTIASLFTGVIFMLLAAKVRKFGAFLIPGAISSLLGLVSGNTIGVVGVIIGSLIAELIANSNHYQSKARIVLAYVVFAVFRTAAYKFSFFYMAEDYITGLGGMENMSPEVIQQYVSYINWPMYGAVVASSIACGFLGAWIGTKVLNKHFVKAGLVKL